MNSILRRRRALMAQGESYLTGYSIVGNPTITNNVMTPNATGWITTPAAFLPGDKPWEIIFKIKKTSNSSYQNLLTATGLLLQQVSGQNNAEWYVTASSLGDIAHLSRNFPVNQNLWCKMSFNGSVYSIGTSSDGISYSNVTKSSALAIKQSSAVIFGAKSSNTSAVQAEYDLTQMQITIDGKLWWKAVR